MMSSLMPSEKYSCSASPLMLVNGNTAIAGRSSTDSAARGGWLSSGEGGGGWGGASSGLGASSRRGSGLVTRTSPMKRNPLRAMVRTSRWSRPVSPTALRTALIREVSVDSETIRPSQT